MTFEQKIAGVPPELVAQGWRLYPGDDVFQAWLDASVANKWESACVGRLQIFRPVAIVRFPAATAGPTAYAHAGWGEGIRPTAETIKVWPFWWFQWNEAIPVCVKEEYPGATLVCQWMYGRLPLDMITDGKWLGPVLPPTLGAQP